MLCLRQVLWAMHLANLDDIILFMAQSDDEQQLCMHVLEVRMVNIIRERS